MGKVTVAAAAVVMLLIVTNAGAYDVKEGEYWQTVEAKENPYGGGEEPDEACYFATAAYFGGIPSYPPLYHPSDLSPKTLANDPYMGGWLDHMDVIKREDEWYWLTWAGWYHYQGYYWEDLPADSEYQVNGRQAVEYAHSIYAWNADSGAWAFLGNTGSGTAFSFDVSDYVKDGVLHVLCVHSDPSWNFMDCSFVHVITP